jgi:hypothetical protein
MKTSWTELHVVAIHVATVVNAVERPRTMVVPHLVGVVHLGTEALLGLIATDLLSLVLQLGWEVWSFSCCCAAFTAAVGNAGVQMFCRLHNRPWPSSIQTTPQLMAYIPRILVPRIRTLLVGGAASHWSGMLE